jgi:hypothetical protein
MLEGRGRARRRLGEAPDADQGEMLTQVMSDGGRKRTGGARVPRESGRDGEASRALVGGARGRERGMQGPGDPGEEATPDARSASFHGRAGGVRGRQRGLMQRTMMEMRGRARRRLGEDQDADEVEMFTEVISGGGRTADSILTGFGSQPRKRFLKTVASRIVSVLGAECGLDPTTVLLSEVSDWMEQSAHVIRICGERYTPPHKWSHLRGAAKLWSASAVRDLSALGEPWVTMRAQYNVPLVIGIVEAVDLIVAESARRRALYKENCRHLHKVVDKIESEARDYLAIRDRVREAQIGFLQRSCRLPVVAMFSKELPPSSERVMDIVSGLDWAGIREHT